MPRKCGGDGGAVVKVKKRVKIFAVCSEDAEMDLVGCDGKFPALGDGAVTSAEHAHKARAACGDDFAADFIS